MRAITSTFAATLLILTWVLPATAQNSTGYAVTPCKLWTKEREAKSAMSNIYGAWILGFVSGINAMNILTGGRPQDFLGAGVVPERMIAIADNECGRHPEENLEDAGFAVVSALKGY